MTSKKTSLFETVLVSSNDQLVELFLIGKINFQDIETIYQNSKPKIILKSSKKYNFLVSLSHEKDYAVAVVISEKIK